MELLDYFIKTTDEYIKNMPKKLRKTYGQFFTSKETAVFMSDMFEIPSDKPILHILDPGAGTGILSAALIDRLNNEKHIKAVYLTCYENDPEVVGVLQSNLDWLCKNSRINIQYRIINDNYITSQHYNYNGMIGAESNPQKYDLIIGNPPYMKISKDAPETVTMRDVCYGAPNLYFLFASMSIFNMSENGEMVYIIPRSWTSGAYFKRFRQKLFSTCVIERVHLFGSRDKVFDKESVLQETIIIKAKKTINQPEYVRITSSKSCDDFNALQTYFAPYNDVVSGNDKYVYLITNAIERDAIDSVNIWNETLTTLGLPMKTGLTVDFRNKDELRDNAEESAVPLFYSYHIKNGTVVFPAGKKNEYIKTDQSGLLQDNENYLFVKRFTAKEEHRRLQCGVYLSENFPDYSRISTQNKINFVGGKQHLSQNAIYGLYVIFNSTLYDTYYRILNGSTQVNSTEINSIPVPPLVIIEKMGKDLIRTGSMSETACDEILRRYSDEEAGRGTRLINRIERAG